MSLSDTPHRKNSTATEFYGNKSLQDFFGDNKVYFETEYIYKSDFSEIILNGDAPWYHIPNHTIKTRKGIAYAIRKTMLCWHLHLPIY